MEATINVLVDRQGVYPKRNNPSFPAFGSGNSRSSSNCFLLSASQQLFLDAPGVGVGAGAGFLGPRPPLYASCPPPLPTYSSLPSSHLLQQPHPPLLPTPLSKSSSLPSPSPPASTRRAGGAAAVQSANKESKKVRSYPGKPQPGGTRPQKEPAAVTPPARVPKSAAFKDEPPEEEEDIAGDVYSLSPPPSSLPMPKFSLRSRTDAEAYHNAGASDDLRRLLRL